MSCQRHVGFRQIDSDGKVKTVWVDLAELVTVAGEIVCHTLEAEGKPQTEGDRIRTARQIHLLLEVTVDVLMEASKKEAEGR